MALEFISKNIYSKLSPEQRKVFLRDTGGNFALTQPLISLTRLLFAQMGRCGHLSHPTLPPATIQVTRLHVLEPAGQNRFASGGGAVIEKWSNLQRQNGEQSILFAPVGCCGVADK